MRKGPGSQRNEAFCVRDAKGALPSMAISIFVLETESYTPPSDPRYDLGDLKNHFTFCFLYWGNVKA